MTKDEIIKILDDFYDEMKDAEMLAYKSCCQRDEKQMFLFNKYAELLEATDE